MLEKVPILFIIFNRVEETKISFEKIRQYKPKQFFIASDGGRNENENLQVRYIRSYLLNNINWECEVKTFFSDENKGCKYGPSNAITWFFKYVEEGIIIEDDCVIDVSFFEFCEHILPYYRNEKSIYHIDASNFCETPNDHNTFHFSHYALIWGWATWRRAWEQYDVKMNDYKFYENIDFLDNIFFDLKTKSYWYKEFKSALNDSFNSWDYQWFYTIWKNKGLVIRPNMNLVKNIGFDHNATHTSKLKKIYKQMKIGTLHKPYLHPNNIKVSYHLDHKCSKKRFNINNIFIRLFNKLSNYN